jgi:hypothetical protein
MLFVSVASKGFSWAVSPLVATLAGRSISVAAKRLREGEVRSRVEDMEDAECREYPPPPTFFVKN